MEAIETKHTKGPWTLETKPTQIGICHKIGPFPGSCGRDVGHACIYVDGAGPRSKTPIAVELLANAVLMKSSPDLLEACIEMLAVFKHIPIEAVGDYWAVENARKKLKDAVQQATDCHHVAKPQA